MRFPCTFCNKPPSPRPFLSSPEMLALCIPHYHEEQRFCLLFMAVSQCLEEDLSDSRHSVNICWIKVLFNLHGNAETAAQGGRVNHPRSCPDAKQQSQENPGTPRVTSRLTLTADPGVVTINSFHRGANRLERGSGGRWYWFCLFGPSHCFLECGLHTCGGLWDDFTWCMSKVLKY